MKWFKLSEFECNDGCGFNIINLDFVSRLDDARDEAGIPFSINSGCRCIKHNAAEGGSETSSHLYGLAADIRTPDSYNRYKMLKALLSRGFTRILIYPTFIHVDVDELKPSPLIGVRQ